LPFALNSLLWWIEVEFDVAILDIWVSSLVFGALNLIAAALATATNRGLWISAVLWASQVLFIISGVIAPDLLIFVLELLAMSITSWVIGVLTLRRGWRIVGFLNLIVAWIVAGVLIYQGMTPISGFVLLLVTAVLLAVITYLTQSRDELLARQ
ncbi:hypothetical protein N9L38_05825, partial [Candidatus Poseidoniales archaeon]|nr:hypothetical protein [Candidatus Poseidoniales archaeon]